jgi:hypothetical protein
VRDNPFMRISLVLLVAAALLPAAPPHPGKVGRIHAAGGAADRGGVEADAGRAPISGGLGTANSVRPST